MRIKDHNGVWPPGMSADIGARTMTPNLNDKVQSAKKMTTENGHIVLRCWTSGGISYEAIVSIPDELIARAILLISDNAGMTLQELGDVELS